MVLGESRTAGRRGSATVVVCGVSVVELVPHFIVVSSSILFIESHDVHHGLWVLFLFLLRDSVLLEQPLPLFGEAGELAGLVVIADVSDMNRIFRC
jgi:hypothetical protein